VKYMLMMNAPGKTPYQIFNWAKADIEAHIGFMRAFAKKLSSTQVREVFPSEPGG
jgi:hypothetical protein